MVLGVSLWSKEVVRVVRMAREVRAGTAWVNTHFHLDLTIPLRL